MDGMLVDEQGRWSEVSESVLSEGRKVYTVQSSCPSSNDQVDRRRVKLLAVVEERYRQIVAAVDAEFARNRELHRERIRCRSGCTDCCHHIFRITRIEADEISKGLDCLEASVRESLEARAREYIEARLLRGQRVPCPALEEGVCSIYEYRPLLCHKFGMPLYNPEKPGRIFACELNFKDGEEIEDPRLIQIQTDIHHKWKQLQSEYQDEETGTLTVAHAILRASARRT